MLRVLEVTLPVFALVFCGYLGQRLRMLPQNTVEGMNAFVFNFALPAMLFRVVSTQPASAFADARFAAGYVAATLALFVLVRAVVVRRAPAATPAARSRAAAFALNASHGNVGYLGVPLALELGQRYAATLVLAIVCDVLVIITATIALLELERRREPAGPAAGHPVASVVAGLVRSPLLIAIAAGFATTLAELRLPAAADNFVRLISGAAGPCALFAIGASLGTQRIALTGTVRALVGVKLVVHPLVAAAALAWVARADPAAAAVGVLAASLPSASNGFIIAQRYGVDVREISSSILAGTFASVATVSFVIWATGLR